MKYHVKYAVRQSDRKIEDEKIGILCIGLQQVTTLPKANVSSFYYKRKFNLYNLSAHIVSKGVKKVSCTIWNNIMLNRIIKDFPLVNQLILWFDSCVLQNRNSYISTMLREIIAKNSNIDVLQ